MICWQVNGRYGSGSLSQYMRNKSHSCLMVVHKPLVDPHSGEGSPLGSLSHSIRFYPHELLGWYHLYIIYARICLSEITICSHSIDPGLVEPNIPNSPETIPRLVVHDSFILESRIGVFKVTWCKGMELRIAQIPIDGLESPGLSTNRECSITPVIVIPWVQDLSGEVTSVANLRENVWWSRKYKPSWSFHHKNLMKSDRISWIPLNPTIFPGSYPSSVATGTISQPPLSGTLCAKRRRRRQDSCTAWCTNYCCHGRHGRWLGGCRLGNFTAPLWVSWATDGHFRLINEDIPGAVGIINEYNRFVYSYSNDWIVYLFQWKFQGPKIIQGHICWEYFLNTVNHGPYVW